MNKVLQKIIKTIGLGLLLVLLAACGNNSSSREDIGNGGSPWTIQLGSAEVDYALGVATDSSGNVYVAGYTEGELDGNSNAGYGDLFIVKYAADGTKLWSRQLGTTDTDSANDVATDSAGNIYVAGETWGGLDGNAYVGESDAFLVKYATDGTRLWTRQLGTALDDSAWGVAVDDSGYVYVAGYTGGDLDGNVNAGFRDVFVTKYNSASTRLWTRQYGTGANDIGLDIAADEGNNVFVVGQTSGDLDGNTSAGGSDLFVTKFGADGTRKWTRQLGTADWESAWGVTTDDGANAIVVGGTGGDLDGNINAGTTDLFVVKYAADGTKYWTRQLGTSLREEAYSVAADSNDNIYVTGSTWGDLDGNTSAGESDLFLIKYTSNGDKAWTRQFGTTEFERVEDIAIDGMDNVFVAGYTYGGLDGNINAGQSDAFVVKYNANGV